MKHKHADKMLEYANDAQTSDKPWLLWQTRPSTEVTVIASKWVALETHPIWAKDDDYRKIISEAVMDAFIQRYLADQPMQVKQSDQAELYQVLSKQEPFYEDYGQFCGGYQTLKFRVWELIYTVELDPNGRLLNITYKKKAKHV